MQQQILSGTCTRVPPAACAEGAPAAGRPGRRSKRARSGAQAIDPKSDGAARDWVAIYDECSRILYQVRPAAAGSAACVHRSVIARRCGARRGGARRGDRRQAARRGSLAGRVCR